MVAKKLETKVRELGYHYRVVDGLPQKKVSVTVASGSYEDTKVSELVERSRDWIDPVVTIEHEYETHPDYSCELKLQLEGWLEITEADVDKELARLKNQHRYAAKERAKQIKEQAEQQLAQIREQFPDLLP